MQRESDAGPQPMGARTHVQRQARGWFLLAGAIYAVILVGALAPDGHAGGIDLVPLVRQFKEIAGWLRGRDSPSVMEDIAINLLLLIPFAVPLSRGFQLLRGPRRFALPSLLIGSAASVVIEFCQLFAPSRVTDTSDIILNSLGVALTVWFMRRFASR